jgi:hypothetical protein
MECGADFVGPDLVSGRARVGGHIGNPRPAARSGPTRRVTTVDNLTRIITRYGILGFVVERRWCSMPPAFHVRSHRCRERQDTWNVPGTPRVFGQQRAGLASLRAYPVSSGPCTTTPTGLHMTPVPAPACAHLQRSLRHAHLCRTPRRHRLAQPQRGCGLGQTQGGARVARATLVFHKASFSEGNRCKIHGRIVRTFMCHGIIEGNPAPVASPMG